jgi:hypothetical protein
VKQRRGERALSTRNQGLAAKIARTEALLQSIEKAHIGAHGLEAYGTPTAHLNFRPAVRARLAKKLLRSIVFELNHGH